VAVTIRAEAPADHDVVETLVAAAFADPAHGVLVAELRAEPSYRPERALVAVDGDDVVGYVLVTDSGVADGGRVATLSPLAVRPDRQRCGLGAALVAAVLAVCDAEGEPVVVLEGDPGYYGRLGFEPAAPHGIVLPLPSWAPPEAGQLHRLAAWPDHPRGTVTYPAPFARFEEER
jgi:putative acetyltransferase